MKRTLSAAGAVIGLVLLMATAAYAAPDATTVTAVDAGALTLKDTLVAIGEDVLPYAAAVLALLLGWRMARKFVRA